MEQVKGKARDGRVSNEQKWQRKRGEVATDLDGWSGSSDQDHNHRTDQCQKVAAIQYKNYSN